MTVCYSQCWRAGTDVVSKIFAINTGEGFFNGTRSRPDCLGKELARWQRRWVDSKLITQLYLSYFLHVVAELSISPIALSFITKLAPVKYASLMMGTYFAITGLGNKVAGMLGEAAQDAGEMAIFTGITVFTFLLGVLILLFVNKLKALSHGAEDVQPDTEFVEPE